MWFLSRGFKSECAEFHGAFERVSNVDEAALKGVAVESLLAQLPERARQHANVCGDCRSAAGELLEVRRLFRHEDNGAEPGPYFLTRVMAAITDREAELEKSVQTWAAVPRLAYRLSVLASLSLLVAGGWLYQQPRHVSVAGLSIAQNNEGLVEGTSATTQDEFLLNSADR
jgi:hypothetical protein